jgi:hypothetical protein
MRSADFPITLIFIAMLKLRQTTPDSCFAAKVKRENKGLGAP